MKLPTSTNADLPLRPPVVERRQLADRRATWRGGRRDSDWLNRPPGALTAFESLNPPVARVELNWTSLRFRSRAS